MSTVIMSPKDPNELYTITGNDLVRIRKYGWDRDCYTPEFYAAVLKETQFERLDWSAEILPAVGKEIVLGNGTCPLCGWNTSPSTTVDRRIPALHRGKATGLELFFLVVCPCRMHQLFWERWAGKRATLGERYQDVRLSTLTPDTRVQLPLEAQAQVIAHLQNHPHDCYLFCGETGQGKTTYQAALYCRALQQWASWVYSRSDGVIEGVWRIETATLLRQHMDWNRRLDTVSREGTGLEAVSAPALPMVRKEDIVAVRKRGFRPRLFLDEIDKSTLTVPQKAVLFDIIDTVYQCNGQLVVCANSNLNDLEDMLGSRMGAPVIRRIISSEDTLLGIPTSGTVFDFFDPEWTRVLSTKDEAPPDTVRQTQQEVATSHTPPTKTSPPVQNYPLDRKSTVATNLRMNRIPRSTVTTAAGVTITDVNPETGVRKFGAAR